MKVAAENERQVSAASMSAPAKLAMPSLYETGRMQ